MKKQIMSIAAAVMMTAAIPLSSMSEVLAVNSVMAVENTNETTALKTGDILTFSKSDWNITQKSQSDNTESDKLYVYATRLDENGEKSLVAYLDADSAIDAVNVTYNAQYGYTVEQVKGSIGNNYGSNTWSYMENDGTWKAFYYTGSKAHLQTPPLNIRFTEDTIGEIYNLLSDDIPIQIYKKNVDGENELFRTMFKGNDNTLDTIMFINGNEYEAYSWSVEIDYTEVYERAEKHITGTIGGKWLADKPYITTKDISVKTMYLSESNDSADIIPSKNFIFNLEFPESDENGNTVYDENGNPIMKTLAEIEHGDAWIIKNTETVQEISAGDLKYSIPVIEDYDSDAVYFIKIGIDSANKDFLFYRYNPRSGWWDFRVNTADTPMYKAPITIAEFPNELAGGVMYNQKSTGSGYEGNECDEWTKEEFGSSSKTSTILTNNNNYTYTAFFDYGKHGGIYYQYVGIDPIPVYSFGDRTNFENDSNDDNTFVDRDNTHDVMTNAKAGDKLVIDGTEADGTPVHYEIIQKFDNDYIPVGDGDYTVTNETRGIKGEIVDGKPAPPYGDNEEENVLNLLEPVYENSYAIYDMNGEIVDEGNFKNEGTNQLSNLIKDTGMPSKQVKWLQSEPYYMYESASGISNSANAEDYIKESGYFIFDKSETAEEGDIIRISTTGVRGDVNQDGVFGVADLVMEQNYLLAAPLEDEQDFGIANFIASDVCTDGSSDVFDVIALRQMLIEKNSEGNAENT